MSTGRDEELGCIIVLIVVCVCFFGIRGCIRYQMTKPLRPHVAKYANLNVHNDGNANNAELGNKRCGKIIVIDKNKKRIDPVYFSLSDESRATTPKEVGTVVWINWKTEAEGRYTDGAGAYVHVASLTVIEPKTSLVVTKQVFCGSSPPSRKKGGGSRHGSKPTEQIVKYLNSLPERMFSHIANQSNPIDIAEQNRIEEERLGEERRIEQQNQFEEEQRRIAEQRIEEQRIADEKRREEQLWAEEESRRIAERKRIEQERLAEARRMEQQRAEAKRIKDEELARERKLREAKRKEKLKHAVVATTRSGVRKLFKVKLLSKKAGSLTLRELSEIAESVSRDDSYLVWFFLPDTFRVRNARPWAVSIKDAKGKIETKIIRPAGRRR